MKSLLRSSIILIVLIFAVSSCSKDELVEPVIPDNQEEIMEKGSYWNLLWDDFKDSKTWDRWNKTNGRPDYNSSNCNYKSSRVWLGNKDNKSVLIISAENLGNGKYNSGHIKSKKQITKPGWNQQILFEASIKLVAQNGNTWNGFGKTKGAWPAFWTTNEESWPKKGEIDIMEGYSHGSWTKFASNLWYGSQSLKPNVGGLERTFSVGEGWHRYKMIWKNYKGTYTVSTYIDNQLIHTYRNSNHANLKLQNFNNHNVIFNLCVDGPMFNNGIDLKGNTMMWVDWVVVKKKNL